MSSPALNPVMPAPGPRRPIGLILAAVALGLMTCQGFLSAGIAIFSALVIRPPETAQYPAITAVEIGIGVIMLLISGLCAFVVVGIFRLKGWARIGILILGGLLVLFSTPVAILFIAFAFTSFINTADTPGVSPAAMRFIFLGMGGVLMLVALVGIWWLVYFDLRRIRALFARNGTPVQPELLPYASLPPAQGPEASSRNVIEILLTCLAVLYLFGAASGIVMALTQFPLFFLGFTFRGVSGSVVALAFAIFNLGVGIGILRRVKLAWVAALAFQFVGLISTLLMFLPRNRALMADY